MLHVPAVCNVVLRVLVTYLGMFCSYIPMICLGASRYVCTVCNVTCLRCTCCRYVLYLGYSYCYRKSENDICFMKVHRSTLNDVNQLYPLSKLAEVRVF